MRALANVFTLGIITVIAITGYVMRTELGSRLGVKLGNATTQEQNLKAFQPVVKPTKRLASSKLSARSRFAGKRLDLDTSAGELDSLQVTSTGSPIIPAGADLAGMKHSDLRAGYGLPTVSMAQKDQGKLLETDVYVEDPTRSKAVNLQDGVVIAVRETGPLSPQNQ